MIYTLWAEEMVCMPPPFLAFPACSVNLNLVIVKRLKYFFSVFLFNKMNLQRQCPDIMKIAIYFLDWL